MTGVIFSASDCHNQRPHYFIRHFGNYNEEAESLQKYQSSVAKCLLENELRDHHGDRFPLRP
ncbi:hypothetical protein DPMN_094413 [Dreissena polymorpha]|uniref:Uncharacterized protein n=1 Tax=Dreissena polymorpha TaxID=45954 RepID=A0A9D4R1T7_DREPO|nr:hypothetical protein DPMN_094413 [Dreissena polymorpha]